MSAIRFGDKFEFAEQSRFSLAGGTSQIFFQSLRRFFLCS